MFKRNIEINDKKYIIFGDKPWMILDVPAGDKNPAGVIIINACFLLEALNATNKIKYTALYTRTEKGATLPVFFVGGQAREKAEEVVFILNNKL